MFGYIASWFSTPPASPEMIASIKQSVAAHKVVVYSKSWCGFCASTKKLLQSLNQDAYIVDIDKLDNESAIQNALAELTGQRTVPSIFINGKHIGGNSDLQSLHQQNKLMPLLK